VQSNTFKSKSFWTGLAIVITGVGMCLAGQVPEGLQTIAGGLATIFVRDAISKIQPPPETLNQSGNNQPREQAN
jgi:hypothetical protein